jgi:hypothetical protein
MMMMTDGKQPLVHFGDRRGVGSAGRQPTNPAQSTRYGTADRIVIWLG